MNITIFIAVLFILQLVCLAVASKYAKGLKSNEDYFLAGKGIKFFPLMMTFVATQVGGGLILGSAEEAYLYGWSVLFYPMGAALGLIALSLGIGRKLASFNVPTVAQIMEVAYGSALLKKIASLLSITSLFMIFVAQIIASKKFLLSVGVESEWVFIAFWSIVILYTVMGGLKAVVVTDVVQAAFFIIVFLICFLSTLASDQFAWRALTAPENEFTLGSEKIVGWLFMPLFFMVIEQDMAQRCFAGDSGRTVTLATFVSGLITLAICSIPVFFGVLGNQQEIDIKTGASVFMTIIQVVSSPFVSALVGCAIIAAIISTADSLINAISSNLTLDFKQGLNVSTARLITTMIAVFGIVFSYAFDNIVDVLIQSYELSVSCLLVPIFIALFKKRGNTLSAALAMSMGMMGFIIFRIYPSDFSRELASILLSLIGFGIGEVINLREKQTNV